MRFPGAAYELWEVLMADQCGSILVRLRGGTWTGHFCLLDEGHHGDHKNGLRRWWDAAKTRWRQRALSPSNGFRLTEEELDRWRREYP